jgi:hypothetical protein
MLEQHLALVFMNAVQRGSEHQLGAWQEQPKKDLVGQRGALDVAGAQTETHGGGVGGNQSQAVPTRHKAVVLGTPDDPVVEQRDGSQRRLGAGLGESLLGALAHQLRPLAQMRKKFIEFTLNALSRATEHQRYQGRQWQFALACERIGMIGMDRVQEKFGRAQTSAKIDIKRVGGMLTNE